MIAIRLRFHRRLALALLATLLVSPVCAEKPQKGDRAKANPSHQKKHADFGHHDENNDSKQNRHQHLHQDRYMERRYFNDQHRGIINTYYEDEFRRGHCPPGLAKKHNGCMPPGQAKRWTLGRPLPRDVVFYDLPDTVIRQIGYPPAGYRMVRVASDILMIAVGTGMVVDAIADLNGR